MQSTVISYLSAYLLTCGLGTCTGISFVDSTTLPVCDIRRAKRNRVFGSLARFGKTGADWFFGFKLHLVVNEKGEILGIDLTTGNVDDRNRSVIEKITRRLFGKLIGDKGYIDQKLLEKLRRQGIELITSIRKNMKNRLVLLENEAIYRARGLIESVNNVLKNVLHIQHTRHRSPKNFLSNLLAGLCAYCFLPHKPTAAVQATGAV